MKKAVVILSLCLVLLLGLCVYLELHYDTPAEAGSCAVQFQVLEEVVATQTLSPGQTPQVLTGTFPGLRFAGWRDPGGNPVDPFTTPVTADITYTAVVYPMLTGHNPYLFADADGRLRPDDVLTADELAGALLALASPGAERYFPELPAGTEPVSPQTLQTILSCFFEEPIPLGDASTLTRSDFAAIMHPLLGRSGEETFAQPESGLIPTDVTADRPDAAILLEASVPHTPAESGIRWQDLLFPAPQGQGFVNQDGWLYYITEDGQPLRDDYVGELYFGADGRYSCGDPVLDHSVALLLSVLISQDPDASPMERLHMAYDYCLLAFRHRDSHSTPPEMGATGWEIAHAKAIFETGQGNSYGFTAAFWALARGLGFEAQAVSGALADGQSHSWCFITIDGTQYLFDPHLQYQRTQQGAYDGELFCLPESEFSGYQWN